MKKLFIIMTMLLSCSVFAEWHSWNTPPKEGQLYMTVDICPGVAIENRQILIIQHFHPDTILIKDNGWWDAEPYDILKWFNEGSKVLYLPSPVDDNFIDRIKDLNKY